MEQSNKEICSIRIMFPVNTDEQAIDIKKKVNALLAGIPDAHTNFSIGSIPNQQPPMMK